MRWQELLYAAYLSKVILAVEIDGLKKFILRKASSFPVWNFHCSDSEVLSFLFEGNHFDFDDHTVTPFPRRSTTLNPVRSLDSLCQKLTVFSYIAVMSEAPATFAPSENPFISSY